MLNFTTYKKINERLTEINLPSLDPKTTIKNFRSDIMLQLDDDINQYIQKEIENVILVAGYEVLDAKLSTFEQFYYNFKIEKSGLVYAMTVSKNSVSIYEGTANLDKEDFYMYIHGYYLGHFETIQETLLVANEYDKLRKSDDEKGIYTVLWSNKDRDLNKIGKKEYLHQSVPKKLLLNREKLEDALDNYWIKSGRNPEQNVPCIFLGDKRYYFNQHGLRTG